MADGKKEAPKVSIEISAGEALDRYTICLVKADRVEDAARNAQAIAAVGEMLKATRNQRLHEHASYGDWINELLVVHGQLWDVENEIRGYEAEKNFDQFFVRAARRVYQLNDKRSEIKSRIDKAYGHAPEIKEYTRYGQEEAQDDSPPSAGCPHSSC
jgi:hypothetical protein